LTERGKRVVILGGGAGGIAAAWRLSDPRYADHIESVAVYQRGWRIGGKGASSRGVNGRIEEHGLHVWLGYYDNAFRFMREVYAELDRPTSDPSSPIQYWWNPDLPGRSAFAPVSTVGLHERRGDGWADWIATFSENDRLPGEPVSSQQPMNLIEFIMRSLRLLGDFYLSNESSRPPPGPSMGGRPHPPERTGEMERLIVRTLQTGIAAASVLANVASVEISRASEWLPALGQLTAAVNRLNEAFRRISSGDRQSRRLSYLADLILTTVRGILADGLVADPDAFDAIDEIEYRDWMRKHGASEDTLDSPLVRGVYDLAFGYKGGDPDDPQFSAGTGILLSGKFFFDYKGSIFWKMQAGMGDVVFAPAYQALRRRGVRFHFFHRIDDLVPDDSSRDIARIEGGVQVALRSGFEEYEPLTRVKDLAVFPAEPIPDQLATGGVSPGRVEVEMLWTAWDDAGRFTLERGRDFDVAILAIPVGMAPYVCSKLIERDGAWRRMVEGMGTVATQAVQVWLDPGLEEIGWTYPDVTITGYVKPFDTWSSMTHLIPLEDWPRGETPQTLGYFCNTLPTGGLPPADDVGYPARETRRVRANALEFLGRHVKHYWPGAEDQSIGGFDWDLLSGAGAAEGEERFDAQFWTANVDPSERYVQSLPGTNKLRMRAEASGWENLILAGDWVDTGLNAGCIEAAVMSGYQAANAVLGLQADEEVAGWFPSRSNR
jgi:uncharacterized protein with NAD-binding domain and iron-sulfur cluster